ncbi:MAG: NAD(P)/FAD-dependent oxidoreductase [Thermoleophilaceae bacterium]
MAQAPVAIIGGGVVGAAIAYTLATRGIHAILLEAEPELGLAASGTNSGILHTGFDSPPGELETELILRAAALREPVLDELHVPLVRCGAELVPHDDAEAEEVAAIAERARTNGVAATLRPDGVLEVPGEAVTDPVAYTQSLAAAAAARGADIRTRARVDRIGLVDDGLALGLEASPEVMCTHAVNCAGLYADDVARMAGDDSFAIYPRKGEFFVFDPPEPLERILLPVPTKRTKGVLVFPRVDGRVAAGPTAVDQEDKNDWSVRPEAQAEVMAKARTMWPPLADLEPVASYAGLRPAGRGVNYVIAPSPACPRLINVAAIRSTGLTASLGIADYVADMLVAGEVAAA